MSNVRLLEANYQCPEFRQAQPLRHLALEDSSLPLASAAFSGDDKHKSRVACSGGPQETQKGRVGFVLGQPVQIEAAVDCFFAASDPRAHAASQRGKGRRLVARRFCQLCFF
jgi:hypothetical protein